MGPPSSKGDAHRYTVTLCRHATETIQVEVLAPDESAARCRARQLISGEEGPLEGERCNPWSVERSRLRITSVIAQKGGHHG
jgi:hypothetical protein